VTGRPGDLPVAGIAATPRRALRAAVTFVVIAALAGTTVQVFMVTDSWTLLSYWFLGAGVIAACAAAFHVGYRFEHLPVAEGDVLCVVPVYNEPADILARTVDALLAQTVPVRVIVMDDGSATPVRPTTDDPRVEWRRQGNTGKRGAQVAVLRTIPRNRFRFILTVDSDSQPHPDACEHLLRAMSDTTVQAATGMIYTRNHHETWVSMAADLDIGGSCVMMRASRSMLGALETTSGALALYRSELLYDHLDAYAVECGTGDDRWLALRALERGKVVGVSEAWVQTEMPTTIAGTYRQRLRWARSWWWMLPYVFGRLGFRQILSPVYGLLQLAIAPIFFAFALVTLFGVVTGTGAGDAGVVLTYLAAYAMVRYGIAALYLIGRPCVSRAEKLRLLVVGAPLAVLLNVVLLTPVRYWALLRLFDNRWQTRNTDPNAGVPGEAFASGRN